jgi:hypothetical protein
MGQPEQFAKDTFAADVGPATHGALAWKDPPEIRLLKVQADGMLLVKDPVRLLTLEPPWREAAGHDEILLELKMAGDHTDPAAVERMLLRRQARQVERLEDAIASWSGVEPIWVAAPLLPPSMRARYKPKRFAPGCYRIGPAVFSFIWIASNELPLRDDLVPFLLTRSGKALDEFGMWAATRFRARWVLDMVECVAMSDFARDYVFHRVEDNSPEQVARRRALGQLILQSDPDLARPFEDKARLAAARSALRRVFARRGLVVSPADDARVEACTDVALLERWLDEAVVAKTAAGVFGAPAKKPRATLKQTAR